MRFDDAQKGFIKSRARVLESSPENSAATMTRAEARRKRDWSQGPACAIRPAIGVNSRANSVIAAMRPLVSSP